MALFPQAVVMDIADGYVWSRDALGEPFTEAYAKKFADMMNADRDEERQTFQAFRLVRLEVGK